MQYIHKKLSNHINFRTWSETIIKKQRIKLDILRHQKRVQIKKKILARCNR